MIPVTFVRREVFYEKSTVLPFEHRLHLVFDRLQRRRGACKLCCFHVAIAFSYACVNTGINPHTCANAYTDTNSNTYANAYINTNSNAYANACAHT